MVFCPVCGKKGITGSFCQKHEPVEEGLEFKEVIIEICQDCDKVQEGKLWKQVELESFIRKSIIKSLGKKVQVNLPNLHTKNKQKGFVAEIIYNDMLYDLPVKLIYPQCGICSRKKTQYFEGILQLRNPTDVIMGFLDKETHKLSSKGFFISKTVKQKKGMDIYVSSQKLVQNVGIALQKRFGGVLKINATLFSHDKQRSKDVYRVNVYYEAPLFKEYDIVVVEDTPVVIERLGKVILGRNLITGKRKAFTYKENINYEILKKQKVTISMVRPRLEVLHPETFQSTPVENISEVDPKKKVYVVEYKEKMYIVS